MGPEPLDYLNNADEALMAQIRAGFAAPPRFAWLGAASPAMDFSARGSYLYVERNPARTSGFSHNERVGRVPKRAHPQGLRRDGGAQPDYSTGAGRSALPGVRRFGKS
jgi:hypothetical protein